MPSLEWLVVPDHQRKWCHTMEQILLGQTGIERFGVCFRKDQETII